MKRYDEHPTWRMLEVGKQKLRAALNDLSRFHPYYKIVRQAHESLVKLQMKVENNICRDMSQD